MTLIKAAKQALEALETIVDAIYVNSQQEATAVIKSDKAITALRTAIEAAEKQEPVAWMTLNAYGEEDDIHYECPEGHLPEGWTYKPLYTHPLRVHQEPVSMRMPKVGDMVICLEDGSLATVVYLTAGGSPEIVFSDGSRGTYLLREFAELFGYTTPPAAQRQWVGLTDEDFENAFQETYIMGDSDLQDFAKVIEAKLKEKNT
jgi:hypothetical protein